MHVPNPFRWFRKVVSGYIEGWLYMRESPEDRYSDVPLPRAEDIEVIPADNPSYEISENFTVYPPVDNTDLNELLERASQSSDFSEPGPDGEPLESLTPSEAEALIQQAMPQEEVVIQVGEVLIEGDHKEVTRLSFHRLHFRTTDASVTVQHGRQSTNSTEWVPIATTLDELDEFLIDEARAGGIEGGEATAGSYEDDGYINTGEEEIYLSEEVGGGSGTSLTLTQTRRVNLRTALAEQEVREVITPTMLAERREASLVAARAATAGMAPGGHVRPAHLKDYVVPPERRSFNIELGNAAPKPEAWNPTNEGPAPKEEPKPGRWQQIRETTEEAWAANVHGAHKSLPKDESE